MSDVDSAIKELNEYKKELAGKEKRLREAIAEHIERDAQSGFDRSVVEDFVNGTNRMADVRVSIQESGNTHIVVTGTNSNDAVWVEFGAGVYHNGGVGTSPHPKGNELGFKIGMYGKGHGKSQSWGYVDDEGLHITHGTPATMPMYRATMNVIGQLPQIVKEVWG